MRILHAMKRLLKTHSRRTALAAAALVATGSFVAFQNCSKVGFGATSGMLDQSSLSVNVQTVYVDFNQPKTFVAQFSSSQSGMSIQMSNGGTSMSMASGSKLAVTDMASRTMVYTPTFGFRSSETTMITMSDKYGHSVTDTITFVVANSVHDIQPAMAVRTSGCITCHASVASNYITDFGAGDTYFFGQNPSHNPLEGSNEALYSDRYADMSWLGATFSASIVLPKVTLGFDLATDVNHFITAGQIAGGTPLAAAQDVVSNIKPSSSLADYIRIMENHKGALSDASNIVEKTTVKIGAPSTAILKTRTQIGTSRFKYYKNSPDSPDLAGLEDKNSYVEFETLTCDGDLVINAPVFLKNLTLKTASGCRIYATGSVFVNGPITYQQLAGSTNANLQIVSSEWINMGVGRSHCETSANPGWYSANTWETDPAEFRMMSYGAPTRENPTSNSAGNQSYLDEEATIPDFIDASCESSRAGQAPRMISYDRVLLNAPRIDSRYQGHFTGVIISEVAIFGLSSFAFTYDKVFDSVAILPFLESDDYLVVQ